MRRAATVFLAALVVNACSNPGDAGTDVNLVGDQVAYAGFYSPDWVIFVISADSSLTGDVDFYENLAEGQFPTWSPDGARIAFLGWPDNWNIYVMNADGSGVTRLTNDSVHAYHPGSWSPDGSRLAFAGGLMADIFVAKTDGTGLTRLTSDSMSDGNPGWAPDGSKIAFSRGGTDVRVRRIYVMNADGSGVIRLTSDTAYDTDPHWSADGSKLAFTRDWLSDTSKSGDQGVRLMNADGSGLHRVSHGRSPRWSPDGTRILFQGIPGIWVADANGANVRQVTDSSYDSNDHASWSPDGTRIAWEYLGRIWIVNADGSGLHSLIQNGCCQKRTPVWRPRKP